MTSRDIAAGILLALGAVLLIAAALLHLSAYRKDLAEVDASNLRAGLKRSVRSLYFLLGWEWIVIAVIMLITAFHVALFKVIVLFCGLSLLGTMAVMIASMGWFAGTGSVLASALIILCGGLLA